MTEEETPGPAGQTMSATLRQRLHNIIATDQRQMLHDFDVDLEILDRDPEAHEARDSLVDLIVQSVRLFDTQTKEPKK